MSDKFIELRKDGWGQFPSDIAQDIISRLDGIYYHVVEYFEWFDDHQTEDGSTYIFVQFKPKYGEGKAYKIVIEPTQREE